MVVVSEGVEVTEGEVARKLEIVEARVGLAGLVEVVEDLSWRVWRCERRPWRHPSVPGARKELRGREWWWRGASSHSSSSSSSSTRREGSRSTSSSSSHIPKTLKSRLD